MGLSVFFAFIILASITIDALYLLHKHKGKHVYGASLPLLPGPVGLPLIENAVTFFRLLRHNPHRALARLAEVYGPIFSFRPGKTCTFVVLSSPALAREALAEKDAFLANRFVPDSVRALAYDAGSMAFLPSSNPLWKQHRVTTGVHLTSGKGLNITRPIRDRHARQLAELLRACSGQPVKVGEGGEPFKDIVGGLFGEWSKPNISDAFPFLAPLDLLGSRRRTSKNLEKLYKLFGGFVERRLAGGESHNDMLDAALQLHAKSKLTRSEIAKLFTDMFIGASETSNITVEWAMAHLLHHPKKMEKLRAEISTVLGSKDFVEESDLDKLPYLHAVVKETLRLHPAVPVVTREVSADGVSLGGFPMPLGTCVLVNLWAIGRDPTAWHEPEEFKPERFLSADAEALHFRGSDFAYRPFGAGRRMCPGLDFAAKFVPLVLASILHRID
ncbi:hypothetical protein QOZ80_6AG0537320 [Eleusine coracana subsp. coracana]|nr:hypothetical protein QOZ80_6AG0537320 [Eleusine coracana subsp. coracana]